LKYLLSILLSIIGFISFAQKPAPSLSLKKATGIIELNGILDEADWQKAEIAGDFYQNFPADTSFAKTKTEVKVTYDDNFIYVGAICYDDMGSNYVIQSLKRDFSYSESDAFAVFIDPFNDQTNGFSFAVNPLGVQREGLLQAGGGNGVTATWDNKWFSKVTRNKDGYVVEMAIPFKSVRYNDDISTWGINFSRNDLQRNENSSWAAVPRNFNIATMAFTGQLNWDNPPKKAGTNISIIPYAITGAINDYQNDTLYTQLNAGLDAKIAVTSSLNLDLTINPDFSQVEVDNQPVNLTRFSISLPEKRQFFIENSDLFSRFGFRQIRPFFSRRIGIHQGQTVPILYGTRLSGKVNDKWRIGLMNMQTSAKDFVSTTDTTTLLGQNYTVAAVQRQVFKRSNIAAIFVNRQQLDNEGIEHSNYNRIAGLDYNIASADNKWQGKLFYHQAIAPGQKTNYEASSNASWLMYSTQKLFVMWNHEYVGKKYNAEVGFVPRNNVNNTRDTTNGKFGTNERTTYWRLEPMAEYKFYPKSGPINFHGPALYYNLYTDHNFDVTDAFIMPHYKVNLRNTSSVQLHYHEWYTKLPYGTDVTFLFNDPSDTIPSGEYRYRGGVLKLQSDKRKKLNWNANIAYGSYYIGDKFTINGGLKYRIQPWGVFSMTYSNDRITLPAPYGSANITRIGPKIELSFTKSVFFSTLVQYNTQIENVNINARLQWRFKPMSDLYIVYTDNYDPYLRAKNRALVVKFIYWLSL
jgi:hypothetical protein